MANELILIVEDNPRNLKLLRDTLQAKGYQTIEGGTGEQRVQMARERQPALVLMDIQVHGISGIESPGVRGIGRRRAAAERLARRGRAQTEDEGARLRRPQCE